MTDLADMPSKNAEPDIEGDDYTLEGGAYEVLRKRLVSLNSSLCESLEKINARRKEVFGSQESQILGSERLQTENKCIPRDITCVGDHFIFGYNVFIGLKSETQVGDVLSIRRFDGKEFHAPERDLLANDTFVRDFKELYKYYKKAHFLQFINTHGRLLLIFQTGEHIGDVKVFRFTISADQSLRYIDDRGDMEYRLPPQHDFEWLAPTRDDQVTGLHPHISINDKVFVECVGGDLTIKVENNTESGEGVYSEAVENPDQTLDDALIRYAEIEDLVLLKIRPYRETVTRYFVYNTKHQSVDRIDSVENACLQLPEGHGIIFPKGYYLQDGGIRQFEEEVDGMVFLECIKSPNGEDLFYIFYHQEQGRHILIQYNLISKEINNPISCHGFSIFEDGKMVIFNAPDDEPRRNHSMQIWQTPFYSDTYEVEHQSDSFLTKIGNRELVRSISEGYAISRLTTGEKITLITYQNTIQSCTNLLDGYHWLDHPEVFNIQSTIHDIKTAAIAAVDEYEKVVRIRENTEKQIEDNESAVKQCLLDYTPDRLTTIDLFIDALNEIRTRRGHVISLRELRYANLERIDELDSELVTANESISFACTNFLLNTDSLLPYIQRNEELAKMIGTVNKMADIKPLSGQLEELASRLDLLTDVVNNLKIDDATHTAKIVNSITDVYAGVNRTRAFIRNIRKNLGKVEAKAEFAAQYKLLSQSITNYIGMCDTPEKCDELLTKIVITIEELEGRFADFEDYVEQLAEKREEAYSAFAGRKQVLEDETKRRVGSLISSADRILKGIVHRAEMFREVDEVNGYFASDMMISKLRDTVRKLQELGDAVKADELSGRLKSTRDEIVRRLRDKLELFDDTENVINFAGYKFSVNTQPLELSMVPRDGRMAFHLTGTDYFEPVEDPEFLDTKELWDQQLVSEDNRVYRAEYLAHTILTSAVLNGQGLSLVMLGSAANGNGDGDLLDLVRSYAANRYNEGYEKGVHDRDATLILKGLVQLYNDCGLLRYDSLSRAYAVLFWCLYTDEERKQRLRDKLRSFGSLDHVFGHCEINPSYIDEILQLMKTFFDSLDRQIEPSVLSHAAEYLYYELQDSDRLVFTINKLAHDLYTRFIDYLKRKNTDAKFFQDIESLKTDLKNRINLAHDWVSTYIKTQEDSDAHQLAWEVVAIIVADKTIDHYHTSVSTFKQIEGLLGQHPIIVDQKLPLYLDRFLLKMKHFRAFRVPLFEKYTRMRKELTEQRRKELRLSEFLPKVMGSFVRNKLINDVYLNLVGANFAKQMGVVGDDKRTDLMGLLLLISPPGYGKTTLMEYVANRLGITFMKINGPAIGHHVTSLDPAEAPNATAREELKKMNLALEMGNNIMIYLDDIQHVNPEFLQKFISLCDAQRKIEGVYNGTPKTYDLRGKKVAVVMAGNPYTESGEKFRIPDMLANRADTYNLGDISAAAAEAFAMSFIENAMTSNSVLSKIASHSHDDIYRFLDIVRLNSQEGIEFDYNYSAAEIDETTNVLKKLVKIRDVILKVNKQYIYSAAQADEYRTEPPFKLQGSYRNMNRIAEKVYPIMTDEEVDQLILDHYNNEAQTLTTGAESNILKFKKMMAVLTEDESERWDQIKREFNRRQTLAGIDDSNDIGKVLAQLSGFNANMGNIRDILDKGLNKGLQDALAKFIDKREVKGQSSPDIRRLHEALIQLAKKQSNVKITNTFPKEYADAWLHQTKILESITSILRELQDNSETNVKLRELLEHLMKGSLTVEMKK